MISDFPSSHRSWKGRYFFVSGHNWEYDPLDKDDTLGISVAWTVTPARLADPNRSPGRETIYTISIYYTVLGLSLTCSFSELYLYL